MAGSRADRAPANGKGRRRASSDRRARFSRARRMSSCAIPRSSSPGCRDLGTQDWTTWGWRMTTFGALVKSVLGDHWKLAAGLFHSLERDPLGYQPYLTLTTNQTADSVMDVAPPFTADSTSGEMRVSRAFTNGTHRQQLQFAIRGRAVEREFGGDAITDLGTIALSNQARFAQPAVAFAPPSRDVTRQLGLGLTFEERWQDVGSFAVGGLKQHYRRTVPVPPGTVAAHP